MSKRIAFMVVGAGAGALVGVLVDFLGAGAGAIIAGAAVGALLPVLFGPPGK